MVWTGFIDPLHVMFHKTIWIYIAMVYSTVTGWLSMLARVHTSGSIHLPTLLRLLKDYVRFLDGVVSSDHSDIK